MNEPGIVSASSAEASTSVAETAANSPPPPANQIVRVKAAIPGKGLRSMDTVWVTGTMRTERGDTERMATFSAMTARLRKLRESGTAVPMQ